MISGSQGSGKTTFSSKIKTELEKKKLKVLVLSIDNFYLSKKDREKISKKITNLLLTRGVPGTHNLKLLKDVLNNFKKGKKIKYKLPLFSKGHDDILKSKFINLNFPYDVFILEGWCVGYQGVVSKKLKKPVNQMEKNFDRNLKWREYVNSMSKKYALTIYKKADFSVFLKIPISHWIIKPLIWFLELLMRVLPLNDTRIQKPRNQLQLLSLILFHSSSIVPSSLENDL